MDTPASHKKLKLADAMSLAPGAVYLMVSSDKPGKFKIGLAFRHDLRVKNGKTWLDGLEVFSSTNFVDMFWAERAGHAEFASWRGEGEWFTGPIAKAVRFYEKLRAKQAPALDLFNCNVRKAVELGLVNMELTGAPNSALEAVLQWKLPRQKATVSSLLQAALCGTVGNVSVLRLLEDNGLPVMADDGMILFNLNSETPLVAYLDKALGAGRWEHQLNDIAGFNKHAKAVKIDEWLETTRADPFLKNWLQNEQSRRVDRGQGR